MKFKIFIGETKLKKYFNLILVLLVSAFLMQGFQCASREMTTAKVAYQSKDYKKAVEFAKLEIQKNPNNYEAKLLLADSYIQLRDIENAHLVFKDLMDKDTIAIIKERKAGMRNAIWVNAYNDAWNNYSKFSKTKDPEAYNKGVRLAQIGAFYMPRIIDFYIIEASLHELYGDEEKAMEAYKNYVENLKPELDFAKSNNIYINFPTDKLPEKFGKPSKTTGAINMSGDSTRTDTYVIKGRTVHFFSDKTNGTWQVAGWRVNPPRDWLPAEQTQFTPINSMPFGSLAYYYYHTKKDKEAALNYVKLLTILEPYNSDANTSLINLYLELDKKDVAIKEMEELIKADPENKVYWEQYGSLLMNFGDYDAAIEKYKKSLSIDPNYDFALRNIASAYKNKAYKIQVAEQDKLDKDPKYKINVDAFMPYLKSSAEYFERSLNTERFRNDMDVLAELANIYLVTNEKDKLNRVVANLEAIENTIDDSKKENYYLKMIKIYSDMKLDDKLKQVQMKMDQYK